MFLKTISALLLAVTLVGCASVPMASLDQDNRAKEFSPPQNKAALYIYRNENFGAAVPMAVSVNGKALGQTVAKTYFRLNVMPGNYKIESFTENVASLPVTAEPGKNYFVWQEVKMGMWSARSQLQQVGEDVGRAGVMESKLIASSILDDDLVKPEGSTALTPPSQSPSSEPISQKLRDLQILRKDGVITEDDFQKKKQQLLEQL